MSRFLLSAAVVCALCVSMTGSADAGSKTRQNFVTPSGIAVERTIRQSGHGSSNKIDVRMVAPNGAVLEQRIHQNSHHTSNQIKVKRPDGSSFKFKSRS